VTHYASCTNCAVDKATCQRRKEIADGLRGLSVYSIKFRCADRKALFHQGQRISFHWTLWDKCGGYDEATTRLQFSGTVLRESGAKFIVQVDHGIDVHGEGVEAKDVFTQNDQLLVRVRPADMRALDEPAKRVCGTCFWVEGVAEDRCYRNGYYTPGGCVSPAEVALGASGREETKEYAF